MTDIRELKEDELDQAAGGMGFATKTCPDCGNKVAVTTEKNGPFTVVTGGKCSCGYEFGKSF